MQCVSRYWKAQRYKNTAEHIFCPSTPSECHNLLPKPPNSPIVHMIYWLEFLEQPWKKEKNEQAKYYAKGIWSNPRISAYFGWDYKKQLRSGWQHGCDLTDDTTDELAIKGLSRDFGKALTDRDFEHFDGRAEYHFYTVYHLIELIKNSDEQSTIKLFNENKN